MITQKIGSISFSLPKNKCVQIRQWDYIICHVRKKNQEKSLKILQDKDIEIYRHFLLIYLGVGLMHDKCAKKKIPIKVTKLCKIEISKYTDFCRAQKKRKNQEKSHKILQDRDIEIYKHLSCAPTKKKKKKVKRKVTKFCKIEISKYTDISREPKKKSR